MNNQVSVTLSLMAVSPEYNNESQLLSMRLPQLMSVYVKVIVELWPTEYWLWVIGHDHVLTVVEIWCMLTV